MLTTRLLHSDTMHECATKYMEQQTQYLATENQSYKIKNEHYNIKMHYNEHSKSCMKPRRVSRSTDSYSLQNPTCSHLLDRTDWFKPRTKTRIHIQTNLSTQNNFITIKDLKNLHASLS